MRSVVVIRKQRRQHRLATFNPRIDQVARIDEVMMCIDDIHISQHIAEPSRLPVGAAPQLGTAPELSQAPDETPNRTPANSSDDGN
jgi:hypothetical protein